MTGPDDRPAQKKFLKFICLGGASEVGRSCYLLGLGDKFVVLDTGAPSSNRQRPTDFRAALSKLSGVEIAGVVITHGHADHIGGLPTMMMALRETGRNPPIYMTPETQQMSERILMDALRIAESRRTSVAYDEGLIKEICTAAKSVRPESPVDLGGIRFYFIKTNHVPGAAMALFEWEQTRVLYTGDIKFGPTFLYDEIDISKLAKRLKGIDVIICESTYAAQKPRPPTTPALMAAEVGKKVEQVCSRKGMALVPVFALGRTQEALAMFRAIESQYPGLRSVPKYVFGMGKTLGDSAGIPIPEGWIYQDFRQDLHVDTLEELPFNRVMNKERPCIVVSTPGMPRFGAAASLLSKVVDEENSAVLQVGFQDDGSPMRSIFGAEKGKAFEYGGVDMVRKCDAEEYSLAGHERTDVIVNWLAMTKPRHIFLVHGEERAEDMMANTLSSILRPPGRNDVVRCRSGFLYTLDLESGDLLEDEGFVPFTPMGKSAVPLLVRSKDIEGTLAVVREISSEEPTVFPASKLILTWIAFSRQSELTDIRRRIEETGAIIERSLQSEELTDFALGARMRKAKQELVSTLSAYLSPEQAGTLVAAPDPYSRYIALGDDVLGNYRGGRISINTLAAFYDQEVEAAPGIRGTLFAATIDHELAHLLQEHVLGIHAFQSSRLTFVEGLAEYVTYIANGSPLLTFSRFDELSYLCEIVEHYGRPEVSQAMEEESIEERSVAYRLGFQWFRMIEKHLGRKTALLAGTFESQGFIENLRKASELETQEVRFALEEALRDLGEDQTPTVILRWDDGLPVIEMAVKLEVKMGSDNIQKVRRVELYSQTPPEGAVLLDWEDFCSFAGGAARMMALKYLTKWRAKDNKAWVRIFAHEGVLLAELVLPKCGYSVIILEKPLTDEELTEIERRASDERARSVSIASPASTRAVVGGPMEEAERINVEVAPGAIQGVRRTVAKAMGVLEGEPSRYLIAWFVLGARKKAQGPGQALFGRKANFTLSDFRSSLVVRSRLRSQQFNRSVRVIVARGSAESDLQGTAVTLEDVKKATAAEGQSIRNPGAEYQRLRSSVTVVECKCHGGQLACPNCLGAGTLECSGCHGDGRCYSCRGSGRNTCERCEGAGRTYCKVCGGSRDLECEHCNGTGVWTGTYVTRTCNRCGGSGHITCYYCHGSGGERTCGRCRGNGDVECETCGGDGRCTRCGGGQRVWCRTCGGGGLVVCPLCGGEKTLQVPPVLITTVSSPTRFESIDSPHDSTEILRGSKEPNRIPTEVLDEIPLSRVIDVTGEVRDRLAEAREEVARQIDAVMREGIDFGTTSIENLQSEAVDKAWKDVEDSYRQFPRNQGSGEWRPRLNRNVDRQVGRNVAIETSHELYTMTELVMDAGGKRETVRSFSPQDDMAAFEGAHGVVGKSLGGLKLVSLAIGILSAVVFGFDIALGPFMFVLLLAVVAAVISFLLYALMVRDSMRMVPLVVVSGEDDATTLQTIIGVLRNIESTGGRLEDIGKRLVSQEFLSGEHIASQSLSCEVIVSGRASRFLYLPRQGLDNLTLRKKAEELSTSRLFVGHLPLGLSTDASHGWKEARPNAMVSDYELFLGPEVHET